MNYIIPRFVLDHLPIGLAGLFIAAVIAAAMNAISAELNSLSTASVIDFYRRWVRPEAPDEHFLIVSRVATGLWGIFACIVATFAVNLGSLIEVVNRFGSFFYGSILGVFLLAMIPRARAAGAFVGLIAGMSVVGAVNFGAPSVAFLWHNVIGAVTVVIVGMLISAIGGKVGATKTEARRGTRRPRQCTSPIATNSGMITATIASPAMRPDASGTMYCSLELLLARRHTRSTIPPKNMTRTTAKGTSIPMPAPVGDGSQSTPRDSRIASRIPMSDPITSAVTAPCGSALVPRDRISANPAQSRDVGDDQAGIVADNAVGACAAADTSTTPPPRRPAWR